MSGVLSRTGDGKIDFRDTRKVFDGCVYAKEGMFVIWKISTPKLVRFSRLEMKRG